MVVRNVNPQGLAWPDYYFTIQPRERKTWAQKLEDFRAELAEIDESLKQKAQQPQQKPKTPETRGNRWS